MITALDLLIEQPFTTGIPQQFLARMAHYSHRVSFRAGTRIFSEGGRAGHFWLIRDGFVELDANLPARGSVTVDTLGPGQLLGWSWMFAPYRWHFGATAATPVLAIGFDAPGIRSLCDAEPEFGLALTRRLSEVLVERMQATRMRLLEPA
ncbi:Crp/Fnr family transcriptional regulator [Dactylosporangium sp. CA-092794]|uniref:Crp/Fnr family transcriptional regulator n=1 Tax=Dactylosporangium sp. CA-092794 TaxID=3239929 RepID=UPI003D8CB845